MDGALGASGWVGVGLLGPVMYWLAFHHLPAVFAQSERLMDKKDTQLAKAYDDYRNDVDKVFAHCAKETAEMATAFTKSMDSLQLAITSLREELHVNATNSQRGHEADVGLRAKPAGASE